MLSPLSLSLSHSRQLNAFVLSLSKLSKNISIRFINGFVVEYFQFVDWIVQNVKISNDKIKKMFIFNDSILNLCN